MMFRPIRRSPAYRRLSDISNEQLDELKRLSEMQEKEIKCVITEVKEEPKIWKRK